MSSEIEVRRIAEVDNSRFASGAPHFDLDSVVTSHLEGDLRHHCTRVTLMEAFGHVTHYHLVAVHV